jgi:hypothetical protein
MFSKILIKLIDQSITPAILLISTRVISIILISQSNGIGFGFDAYGFSFYNLSDYIKINSYSSFSMIAVLTVGLIYILVKAYVFHDSHITPKSTANVYAFRLHGLIQSSYDLYTQGSIWISYLFFMALSVCLMAFFGIIYSWVALISIALCALMAVLLILDVENELKVTKNSFSVEDDQEEQ